LFRISRLSSRSTSPEVIDNRSVRFVPRAKADQRLCASVFGHFNNPLRIAVVSRVLVLVMGSPSGCVSQVDCLSPLYAETFGVDFDPQSTEAPLTVFLGCANAQTTRPCSRCFTGRSIACPLSRLIHHRPCRTLSTIRINTLPEEMIGMTDNLLTSLPSISPQSTKVTIELFRDVDTIPLEEILPRFRSLGGVVEIGEQRIRI